MAWIFQPDDIWHNAEIDRRKLDLGVNPLVIPGALSAFERHFSAQGPFFRAIFGTISLSGAILGTMSLARYYKSNNFIFETRFQRTLVSKAEKRCRPAPLACPPSSVEMPVCRLVRRTPCMGRQARYGSRQRGICGCRRNDLRGCRKIFGSGPLDKPDLAGQDQSRWPSAEGFWWW
jgi:hypothetical protein